MATSRSVDQTNTDAEKAVADQMLATIYGQCIGDALGLLTEFMTKKEAKTYYGKSPKTLSYDQKVPDFHRNRWEVGDWTDDSDQMLLILQSVLHNRGQVLPTDFARRIKRWMHRGFPELGDYGGMGIGRTTGAVLRHPNFETGPEEVALQCWELSQRKIAPNGAVMRCSILGLHEWKHMEKVVENALAICKTTHYDPRCQASVVAVTSCIAMMLQRTAERGQFVAYSSKEIDELIKEAYEQACTVPGLLDEYKKELWTHMKCTKVKDLKLCEEGKIGYTYKSMGSGFWALKQNDFKKAIVELVMEAGDADTNACVGGALLACKLGLSAIPEPWMTGLKHRDLLLDMHQRFVKLQSEMEAPIEERTANEDLSIANLDIEGDKVRDARIAKEKTEREGKSEDDNGNEEAKKSE